MEEKIPSPGRHKLVLPNPGDPLGPNRAVGLGLGRGADLRPPAGDRLLIFLFQADNLLGVPELLQVFAE